MAKASSTFSIRVGHPPFAKALRRFDSSVGRGDFKTKIGTGQVIRGWYEGVLNVDGGMTLGEKATLTATRCARPW